MTSYRDSRIYGIDEICTLLQAVDRHLASPAKVVIIGGAAAAFHRAESTTMDVDTFEAISAELAEAVARAKTETGLEIPVSCASVADIPYDSEIRFERMLPELRHLQVWVLEKHDLALSKIVRGGAHDLQQLQEVHANSELDFDTLVERYSEMKHAVTSPTRLRQNFLEMIELLFGEMKRVRAEQLLERSAAPEN